MDDEAAALVVDTVNMHYQVCSQALTAAQWEDHKAIGVCPGCADGIDYAAALAARELVTT